MLVGIYVNTNKEFALEVSETLKSRLDDFKVSYEILERGFVSCPDLIIVIGGDGTVLDVAEHAAKSGIPVMALNAGSVGFLSSFETNEIDDCVKSVLNCDFKFDERPLLECNVNGKSFYALNDVSVQHIWDKNINGCTLFLSLNIDGVLADKFRADGIVVATPTGSTAYSLSAGGAILAPKINALIATPLCAHTLRSKPIVFSDDAVV